MYRTNYIRHDYHTDNVDIAVLSNFKQLKESVESNANILTHAFSFNTFDEYVTNFEYSRFEFTPVFVSPDPPRLEQPIRMFG